MQGRRPYMTDRRTTLPENLQRSFSIQTATMADVGSACHFMRTLPKISHMGEIGATDALTFLGHGRSKRHSIHSGTG
jgi:hypothetical protein